MKETSRLRRQHEMRLGWACARSWRILCAVLRLDFTHLVFGSVVDTVESHSDLPSESRCVFSQIWDVEGWLLSADLFSGNCLWPRELPHSRSCPLPGTSHIQSISIKAWPPYFNWGHLLRDIPFSKLIGTAEASIETTSELNSPFHATLPSSVLQRLITRARPNKLTAWSSLSQRQCPGEPDFQIGNHWGILSKDETWSDLSVGLEF